jgi:hypothetical protein
MSVAMNITRSGDLCAESHTGQVGEIHVGAEDWQSVPANVSRLGELMGIDVHVVPGNGHILDKAYVSGVLDGWLPCPA